MATLNGNNNRKSYFLSVTPVDYSLTEGTNIPAPAESPLHSPPEPPTPGGGPLNSHPATPPDTASENTDKAATEVNRGRTDSFRTPTSPASAAQYSSSPQTQRRPSRVRKLLSLTNLRPSFSSSRTSLSQPGTADGPHTVNGTKRPSSPSTASTPASSVRPRPQLREKKSGNWFKRKSGMFMMNEELDTVNEDRKPDRPDTRESKRLKDSSPAPLLPEIGSLKGGKISGGDLGWDERAFKR